MLARAAEVGAAQAGRELGIAPGTIRVWRSRAAARADSGGRVDTPGDEWLEVPGVTLKRILRPD